MEGLKVYKTLTKMKIRPLANEDHGFSLALM